jgi:hypothetical protein
MAEQKETNKKIESRAEERHKKDSLSGIIGGLIIILLGVLFLLRNMGYLWWHNWWAYFLLGLGVILIIDAVIRSLVPQYRRPIIGRLIGGIVLIFIGAGNIYGIVDWWPLILVGVGIAIIIGAVLKHKKAEEDI